jgi:hypothetical protein
MDWMPVISAGAALAGAGITSFFAYRSQVFAQKSETDRAMRRIAYEAAMVEWRFWKERYPASRLRMSFFVRKHLATIALVAGEKITTEFELEEFLIRLERDVDARIAEVSEHQKNQSTAHGNPCQRGEG